MSFAKPSETLLLCRTRIEMIYGADMAGTAAALAYCDYTRRVVAMKNAGYIQNLMDICMVEKIGLLIPTIDTDLLVLSENKDKKLLTRWRLNPADVM